MALVKCPECDNNVSDTCKVCPHCGYKRTKEKNKEVAENRKPKIIGAIIAIILVGAIIIAVIISNNAQEKEKAQLQNLSNLIDQKIAGETHK